LTFFISAALSFFFRDKDFACVRFFVGFGMFVIPFLLYGLRKAMKGLVGKTGSCIVNIRGQSSQLIQPVD